MGRVGKGSEVRLLFQLFCITFNMAPGNEQFQTDFENLTSTLDNYPDITIIATEGDPPEQYEIEYHLKGYAKAANGEITVSDSHRISLNLPFGYPHFAPVVKPLSPIFHPDIDPDAVRIADFWQKRSSLVDLVLHIGEMICGIHFNTDDPFNQAAADWFDAHNAELPLDHLRMAGLSPDEEGDIDTLDDEAFSLLGLEEEEEKSTEDDHSEEIRLMRLRLEQAEVFEASRILSGLPDGMDSPEVRELSDAISQSIQKSNKLHNDAIAQEQQGNFQAALKQLNQLAKVAADHPNLEVSLNRVQDSINFAESLENHALENQVKESKAKPATGKQQEKKEKKTKKKEPSSSIPVKRAPSGPTISSFPVRTVILGVLLVAVVAGVGVLYLKDSNTLQQVALDLQQTKEQIQQQQFQEAKNTADAALKRIGVILLQRSEKARLQKEFDQLLQTENFKQGLAGRVLFDGKYIDKPLADNLQQINLLTEAAKSLRQEGKKLQALEKYLAALQFAEEQQLLDQADQLKINVAALRLETTIGQAKEAEEGGEWADAAKTYSEALDLARALADKSGEQEISRKLATASFRRELSQGKSAFTSSQWQDTIDMLERARQIQEKNPDAVSAQDKKELERLLISSKLFQGLSIAREAYEQGNWDQAIADYQGVLRLLENNAESFGGKSAIQNTLHKIEKTVISLQTAQLQRKATLSERRKDQESARKYFQQVVSLIEDSPLATDADLAKTLHTAQQRVAELDQQLRITRLSNYLIENFKELFQQYYPSSTGSALQNPKATFIEERNGKMLFNLRCIERSQGSSFQLELNYQYDPAADSWTMLGDQ
jgi:tetratricopeptide (TPR) repeat protein